MKRDPADLPGEADARVDLRLRVAVISAAAERHQDANLAIEQQPLRQVDVAVDLAVDRPPRGAEIIGRNGQSRADELAGQPRIDFGVGPPRRHARVMRIARMDDPDVGGEARAQARCIAAVEHDGERPYPLVTGVDDAS